MSTQQNTPKKDDLPKGNTPSTATATPPSTKPAPLGNLKPTPPIEITEAEKARLEAFKKEAQVEDTLNDIEELTKLYKSYTKIDNTLEQISAFSFGAEEEEYHGASIVIYDSNRKSFETKNPRLVLALIEAFKVILKTRKVELSDEIRKVSISR
ncbi:hypothetical protein [Runella sp. SP2]|uniref:hypothetical protein n=1 Tax=Runella sp. SP2 TaxID=2268026 RepID=UPI000F0930CB|nr:hypothetical protein [Runella sp. SP2]AYQ31437.1 hypothetical protein DTQ70_04235 [Runella sp. SP2]